MVSPLDGLAERLAPCGLNLIGVTPAADYDRGVPADVSLARVLPGTRSLVVIGNGGRSFWDAYARRARADPALARSADPLDDFTRAVVTAALADVLGRVCGARLIFPFEFGALPVSFVHLAECAGLGRRSVLGVLIHPVYGPWIALRAALALPEDAGPADRPADGFDPCPTCGPRSCMAACPAEAVGAAGWDIPRCADWRAQVPDPCATRCHARVACVIGPEHRYPDAALEHHQRRARPALLASR